MFADFTPSDEQTLSNAAAALGYIGFDWQQTITNWPDANLRNHSGTLIVPTTPTGSFPPFLDPPVGGYNYNPCGGNPAFGGGSAPGASGAANPFYFTVAASSDCWSLSQNETPTTLTFGDEPMDNLLSKANILAGNIPKFTTDLVGIMPGDMPSAPLFVWTWQTTYNGSATTGITASRSANSPKATARFGGTGHVTITSINGVRSRSPSLQCCPCWHLVHSRCSPLEERLSGREPDFVQTQGNVTRIGRA